VAKKPVVAKKPAPRKQAAPRKRTASPSIPAPAHITPEQALENTRALLAAKQEKAHETPAWQELGQAGAHGAQSATTFQSDAARDRAVGRQQEELRSQGNAGSSAATDRHAQGKRDARD
jgi:hypothetical protein